MNSEAELLSFIAGHFRSVWAVEILRFLFRQPDRIFTAEELIAELHLSKLVVAQNIAALEAAGFILREDPGRVRALAADAKLAQLTEDVITLYETSPDKVRRTIVSQTAPGITAFADAFKFRRD